MLLDRIPTSGRSPAGPQSNQNVWVLPAILIDAIDRPNVKAKRRAFHKGTVDQALPCCLSGQDRLFARRVALDLNENATPVQTMARRVPIAMREPLQLELERLAGLGIIAS